MRLSHALAVLGLATAAAGAATTQAATDGEAPPAPATDRRDDERRAPAPLTLQVFGRPVQVSGSWEAGLERRGNFDLDRTRDRDRTVLAHEVDLAARWSILPEVSAFVQWTGLHETRRTQGTAGTRTTKALERGPMWVQWHHLGGTPWSLQAGRLALRERRAWWWDEDLDALRLAFDDGERALALGVGRELLRVSSAEPGIDPAQRGVWRAFAHARWRWQPRQVLELFALHQHDRSGAPVPGAPWVGTQDPDGSDLRATWAGLRSTHGWRLGGHRLDLRADAAWLRGHETLTPWASGAAGLPVAGTSTHRPVRGHALDLGLTWTAPGPVRPSLTLAWARGSRGFRQTGLHENKGRIAGVKRLQLYGELLQPDLANLRVASLGGGLRLLSNSSLELLHHRYRQVQASPLLAGSRLSTAPLGTDPHLGRAWDLVLALREWQHLELVLRLARFEPGPAFAANRRDPAHAVELVATFVF